GALPPLLAPLQEEGLRTLASLRISLVSGGGSARGRGGGMGFGRQQAARLGGPLPSCQNENGTRDGGSAGFDAWGRDVGWDKLGGGDEWMCRLWTRGGVGEAGVTCDGAGGVGGGV
ncbi:MAG: hypothetical protein SGPRY_006588, partial [Prymnesium sp.]